MGLDVVELVLRCEEDFDVALENDRLEQVQTVGDLLELICEKLQLPSGSDEPRPAERIWIPRSAVPKDGWSRDTVWFKLVAICVDQLQVEPEEIKYFSSFLNDLGAD